MRRGSGDGVAAAAAAAAGTTGGAGAAAAGTAGAAAAGATNGGSDGSNRRGGGSGSGINRGTGDAELGLGAKSSQPREDLGDDGGRGKNVDVVRVRTHKASIADESSDGAQGGVQAEGKELGTKGVPLTGATERVDEARRACIRSHEQLRGITIVGEDPPPQAREALRHHRQKGTAVHGVEGVLDVESNINPVRVLIESSTNCVGDELNARMASNSNLGGPGGTAGLAAAGGRGSGGRGLEVGGEAITVLVGGHHGDGAPEGGPNSNRTELPARSIRSGVVALLAQGNEATTKKPRAHRLGDAATKAELYKAPKSLRPTAGHKGLGTPGGGIRAGSGEVAIAAGEVLVPPTGVISSRRVGQPPEKNLVEAVATEALCGLRSNIRRQSSKRGGGGQRRVSGDAVIVLRVQRSEGLNGRGHRLSELERLRPGSGAAELTIPHKRDDVASKLIIVTTGDESTSSRRQLEEGAPVTGEESEAALTLYE